MTLAAQTRAVDALSTPYARALTRWATTFVRAEVVRAAANPRRYAAGTKQERKPTPGTLADLRRLLLMFGLQRGQDVAEGLGAQSLRGSRVAVPGVDGTWEPSPGADEEGRRVVWVALDRLTRELSRDADTYVGPGGRGAIGDRVAQALAFLRAGGRGQAIHMPELVVRAGGALGVRDGRHRLEALRQLGVSRVPVTVDAEDISDIRKRVGADAPARSMRGSLVDDALAGKPIKIDVIGQWVKAAATRALAIAEDTQERVREHVRRILGEGDRQSPRATVGEITRRIATEIKAGSPDEPEDTGGVFSWARAQTIARTELVQVENTARVVAYAETGVAEIEWLAYRDGRSGERHHERMQGVRVRVGETFTTPLGNSLRYPGDPMGPIGDTANCRCTVRPVRRARSAQ